MIHFESHASGSAGNLYTATDGETSVAIEAGLSFKEIQRALDFQASGLAGALVSHCHGDHAKGVRDLMKAGVDCYMSRETIDELGVSGHHRAIPLRVSKTETIGSLQVIPFDVDHDAPGTLGFVLISRHGGRLLYITDAPFVRYRFKGLTVIALEANYSLEILRANTESGAIPRAHMHRVLGSHMSIERAVELLQANDLSKVQAIHLLHLSDGNSDEADFVERVQRATGKPVYAAPARRPEGVA